MPALITGAICASFIIICVVINLVHLLKEGTSSQALIRLIIALLNCAYIAIDIIHRTSHIISWHITSTIRLSCTHLIAGLVVILAINLFARYKCSLTTRQEIHDAQQLRSPLDDRIRENESSQSNITATNTAIQSNDDFSWATYKQPGSMLHVIIVLVVGSIALSVLVVQLMDSTMVNTVNATTLAVYALLTLMLLISITESADDRNMSRTELLVAVIVLLPTYVAGCVVDALDISYAPILLYVPPTCCCLLLLIVPCFTAWRRRRVIRCSQLNDIQCTRVLNYLTVNASSASKWFDYLQSQHALHFYLSYVDLLNWHKLFRPSDEFRTSLSTLTIMRSLYGAARLNRIQRLQKRAINNQLNGDESFEQLERAWVALYSIKSRWLDESSHECIHVSGKLTEKLVHEIHRIEVDLLENVQKPHISNHNSSNIHASSSSSRSISIGQQRSNMQIILECANLFDDIEKWLCDHLCNEFVKSWLADGDVDNVIELANQVTNNNQDRMSMSSIRVSSASTSSVVGPLSFDRQRSSDRPSPTSIAPSNVSLASGSPRSVSTRSARGSIHALQQLHISTSQARRSLTNLSNKESSAVLLGVPDAVRNVNSPTHISPSHKPPTPSRNTSSRQNSPSQHSCTRGSGVPHESSRRRTVDVDYGSSRHINLPRAVVSPSERASHSGQRSAAVAPSPVRLHTSVSFPSSL